ncbi:MAG: heme-binding protein [Methanobacteriaceae archaeon]|nr:heme-binding protein [Methanobacteriaceae archaeon]
MTESPEYTVERKDGNIEIRKYPGYILAQVDVKSDYDTAIGRGFSILAGYIFGGNKKRSKIPMTAPVSGENINESENIPMTIPVTEEELNESDRIKMTTPVTEELLDRSDKLSMSAPVTEEKSSAHIYRISFTMPSSYTLDTLPVPNDKRIKFKEVKNQRAVVLKFSGRAKRKLAQEKILELKRWLKDNNLEARSNFIVAQYNHPLVPGFLRKNEIIVYI